MPEYRFQVIDKMENSGKPDANEQAQERPSVSAAEKETRKNVIARRLKAVRQALAKTQNEMDAVLGIGKRSWQRYETEGQTPGSLVVAALGDLGFSANWLLNGLGPMHIHEGPESNRTGELDADAPGSGQVAETPPQYISDKHSVEHLTFNQAWLESIGANADDLVSFSQPGDTMADTIPAGALVFADGSRDYVDAPGLWAMHTENGPTVARIQPSASGALWISHDNKRYADRELEREHVRVIGRIVWYGVSTV